MNLVDLVKTTQIVHSNLVTQTTFMKSRKRQISSNCLVYKNIREDVKLRKNGLLGLIRQPTFKFLVAYCLLVTTFWYRC